MRARISIGIIEDDACSGRLLQRIVESADDRAYVVTHYVNAEEAWEAIAGQPPQVMLVDVHLPIMSGIDFTRKVKQTWPAIKVIMVTGCTRLSTLCQSFQAGADGFLEKPVEPAEILWAVDQVLNTNNLPVRTRHTNFDWEQPSLNEPAKKSIRKKILSPRQMQVISMVADGLTDKQTAEALGISVYTICDHWKSIRKKLGKPDRASCIAEWLRFQK